MRYLLEQRAIIGAMIWIGAIAAAIIAMRQSFQNSPDSMKQLGAYVTFQRKTIKLDSDANLFVRVGDPVFLAGSDRTSPIGMVAEVDYTDSGVYSSDTTIAMFGASPAITTDDHFEFHYAPDSMDWLVKTMFTPAKQTEIRELIQDAYSKHHNEIIHEFSPVIKAAMAEASELLKDDIRDALAAREDQLAKIGDRYQKDLVKKEFIPLFQKELWPIIEAEGEPLVTEIGQEIWNEVSVLGFGWRYLYDKSPLPKKKLTEKKFRSFVDQKAKPILEAHTEDFIALQKRIARKISSNEAFKKTVSRSISKILADEEIQQLMMEILKEVALDNSRLKIALKNQMQSPEAQRAMAIANKKLDPTIREIGIAMFGNPQQGITPEFARVLRRRILHKDASWLTLHLYDPSKNEALDRNAPFPESLPVRVSSENTARPFTPTGRVNGAIAK